MRVVLIKMAIKFVRWILIHLVLRPVLERYIELPLYDLLMRISDGGSPEEDPELGDDGDGVNAVGDTEGVWDNPV